MTQKRDTGPLFLFFAALLWSLCGLFTKSVAWDGVSIVAVRGMVALLVIAAVCRPFPIRLNKIKLLTAGCYFAQGLLIILANKYTTAANAAVLQYTSPLYIILFSSIASRKLPRRRDVITCLMLLAGISLAFLGNLKGGGVLGNLLALASALFYASVFYCSHCPGANMVDSMILGNLLYVLFLPWVLTSEAVRSAPLRDLGLVVLFGITAGSGAWLCFARGVRTTPPLPANFITMLEPVLAPLWTFLFLQETVTASSLAGCAVVVVTLIVYNTMEQK